MAVPRHHHKKKSWTNTRVRERHAKMHAETEQNGKLDDKQHDAL